MKNEQKLTQTLVEQYHNAVASYTGARIVTIQDVYQLIAGIKKGASLFELLHILDDLHLMFIEDVIQFIGTERLEEFLKTTAITIPGTLGSTVIYVPWVPGKGNLARQVRVLAHEGTHALRAEKDPDWLANYIAGFEYRKTEEKWAFCTSMELEYWCRGEVSPVRYFLHSIGKYYLPPTHIKVLTQELEDLRGPAAEGALYTEMGKFCTNWLNERIDK